MNVFAAKISSINKCVLKTYGRNYSFECITDECFKNILVEENRTRICIHGLTKKKKKIHVILSFEKKQFDKT